MNSEKFHRTPIGARVNANISNSEHIACVLDKDSKHRKFLLRFNLANGVRRDVWRSATRCTRVDDHATMGQTRTLARYRHT